MSSLAFVHIKESAAVDQAVDEAMTLVRDLAERDPNDNDEANPWREPDQVFVQLDQARNKITAAWDALYATAGENETDKKAVEAINEDDMRAAYMDMVTDAYADVLEELRTNEAEDIDVDVLVDCLQSGLDIMTQDEKQLFMQDKEEPTEETESSDLTPHELRRRQLGFNVEIPSA